MPKTIASDITDIGFIPEMFNKSEDEFDVYIEGTIAKQAPLLEGRIGATVYASTASPVKENVVRAELCMVAIELLKIRKNVLLGSAKAAGEAPDTSALEEQIKSYRDELNGTDDQPGLITTIANGAPADSGSDFACGALVTDHFGGTQ